MPRTVALVETKTFDLAVDAGKTLQFDLKTTYYISRIEIHLEATITTNATNAPTYHSDDIIRILRRIVLAGDSEVYLKARGMSLYWLAYYQMPGAPRKDAPPTGTGVTETVKAVLPIHFGLVPYNRYDPTALVPMPRHETGVLQITLGSIADVGANIDALTGKISVVLHGYERDENVPKRFLIPDWFEAELAIEGATSKEYKFENDKVIRRLVVGALSGGSTVEASDRDGSVVDEFSVKKFTTEVIKNKWLQEQEIDAMKYNKQALDGVILLDADEIAGDILAYTGRKQGTYVLEYTTTKAGFLLVLYQNYSSIGVKR